MRKRVLLILLAGIAAWMPGAAADVNPLVVIGCFDGQLYPPAFCPNYSNAVLDIAQQAVAEAYGSEIEVLTIGDWFFLLDALALPNVIGGFISLREGHFELSLMRQDELVSHFEGGLGLVGVNYMGYHSSMGRVAEAVFPVNGTKSASGKVHRGNVITSRHIHVLAQEHPIAEGLPGSMDIPDGSLVYHHPIPDAGWWMPQEGEVTAIYHCTTASRERNLPSVILYERSAGRSITLPGFRHTDATGFYERDLGWFNHSLSMPEVRKLIENALVYVLEPFASPEPLRARMEESRAFAEEKLQMLKDEAETARRSLEAQRRQSMIMTAVVVIISIVAILGIVYMGFIRK